MAKIYVDPGQQRWRRSADTVRLAQINSPGLFMQADPQPIHTNLSV